LVAVHVLSEERIGTPIPGLLLEIQLSALLLFFLSRGLPENMAGRRKRPSALLWRNPFYQPPLQSLQAAPLASIILHLTVRRLVVAEEPAQGLHV
jgi:hypothetical protein